MVAGLGALQSQQYNQVGIPVNTCGQTHAMVNIGTPVSLTTCFCTYTSQEEQGQNIHHAGGIHTTRRTARSREKERYQKKSKLIDNFRWEKTQISC